MAEELSCNLLSLPDDLLEDILMIAFRHPVNLLKDWAKAAVTCKRLYELQLPFDPPTIRKWEGSSFQKFPLVHLSYTQMAIMILVRQIESQVSCITASHNRFIVGMFASPSRSSQNPAVTDLQT